MEKVLPKHNSAYKLLEKYQKSEYTIYEYTIKWKKKTRYG